MTTEQKRENDFCQAIELNICVVAASVSVVETTPHTHNVRMRKNGALLCSTMYLPLEYQCTNH